MTRVAIGFTTYNKPELSRQSIKSLLQPSKYDLFWLDGSTTRDGKELPREYHGDIQVRTDIRGGSGAAIVCALSLMLDNMNYDYIGLVERDVVLPENWFDETMALFESGKEDGLDVGVVSARCYEDRILIQRDGYAVMHNTGAGMVIFTREAAELVLHQYRTQWTLENRAIFSQLTGRDIGGYWAFRGTEHWLVADWRWDALLASRGLASLALTPSRIEMIGQTPPLEEQGLVIAREPVEGLVNDEMFKRYRDNLEAIRRGNVKLPSSLFHRDAMGGTVIFAHQIPSIGGEYYGGWRLKDAPGFGPFGWISAFEMQDEACSTQTPAEDSSITIPVLGPCEFFISGGKDGGQVHILDEDSGYDARPVLPAEGANGQIVSVQIPGNVNYRTIRVTMMTPGCVFYGLRCRNEQAVVTGAKFNYEMLPRA